MTFTPDMPDPAILDHPVGEPASPWPRLRLAMRDWRSLGVMALIFLLAIWS